MAFRSHESWPQKVFVEESPQRVSIKPVTGIIRVQGYNPVELSLLQLMLQDAYFRLRGITPKLAIQIQTRPGMTGVVFITGGIADRIKPEFIAFRPLWILGQLEKKANARLAARRFISMQAAKNSNATQGHRLMLGARKHEPGNLVNVTSILKLPRNAFTQTRRMTRTLAQRLR
ncbi:MAG TPA: hypothetical protein PLN52_07285 [Opitutaceae bacterium]|nr:hypothetical protein [Opitutaceae bacterium]